MQRTSQVILPEPTVEPADEDLSHIGKYLEKYLNRDRETDYILSNSPSWMEYILFMYANYVHTAESEGKACKGAYLQPGLNMEIEIFSKRSLNPSNSWQQL